MVSWMILIMPSLIQLFFSTFALITLQVLTQARNNGNKSLILSSARTFSLVSTLHIKVLLQVIFKEMLTHSIYSPNNGTESCFSNHLPRTLVSMVKELDASQLLLAVRKRPMSLCQESSKLQDQSTQILPLTVQDLLILS
jgi:hypothetical protein